MYELQIDGVGACAFICRRRRGGKAIKREIYVMAPAPSAAVASRCRVRTAQTGGPDSIRLGLDGSAVTEPEPDALPSAVGGGIEQAGQWDFGQEHQPRGENTRRRVNE
jgi:hypothetical protein